MNAKEFLEKYGRQRASEVAEKAGSKIEYFSQIAYGHRRPSVGLAKRLVAASNNELGLMELLLQKNDQEAA